MEGELLVDSELEDFDARIWEEGKRSLDPDCGLFAFGDELFYRLEE